MPQIGRVEISIMEEDQARLLAFQNGELDLMNMEGPLAPKVLYGGTLTPDMQKKGIKLSRFVDPEISYHYWNLQDPVVGGLGKEKIALRRAMAMAYPVDEEIKVIRNGQAVEAQFPIPPGVVGHDPAYKSSVKYDRRGANALLDKFGYKKGADGFRNAARRQAARDPLCVAARFAVAGRWTRCGRRRSTRSASGWKCRRTSSPSC